MRQARVCFGLCALMALFGTLPAFGHGDKVVPYIPDGVGGDGTTYRTKFDITNLGLYPITNVRLLFFQRNGQAWTVPTNLGTVSEIPLNLGVMQTIRIETLGIRGLADGYAILRSNEGTTVFPEDYEPGITVYYEVAKGSGVIDTVSVPVGQPTGTFYFPSQTEVSQNLVTGFAVVNLSTDQSATVTLWPYRATSPSSGNAAMGTSKSLSLAPGEMTVGFMHQSQFFPGDTSFKGVMYCESTRPVAILALLQTPTPGGGVQYATMVPAYQDSMRRNTFMYLREGYPLDADLPVSDYWAADTINKDDWPWDLLYERLGSNRQWTSYSNASFAVIGFRQPADFDNITLPALKQLSYSTSPVNFNDGSPNLAAGMAFAIKTGLGRYVKVHIVDVFQRGTEADLVLEVYVYK